MQPETGIFDVGIFVDVINPLGIEQGCAPLDPMNFVALFEQKFSKVRTILSRDTGD
jgi:hypothetical protein